ncbi:MAG TPA: hypothetical protein PKE31_01535 [Pseudomonadota bacterium]|nr:hypothetical protein [Pseudomonadota bacterium]
MARIFISQKRVQKWTEEGLVHIEGNLMTLTEVGRLFRLTEAFYVERAVSEGGDLQKIKGKVKTRNQIAQLGGEVFLNSLVIGEAAYEGDPGFVGEPLLKQAKAAASKPDGVPARNLSTVPTGKVLPKNLV